MRLAPDYDALDVANKVRVSCVLPVLVGSDIEEFAEIGVRK